MKFCVKIYLFRYSDIDKTLKYLTSVRNFRLFDVWNVLMYELHILMLFLLLLKLLKLTKMFLKWKEPYTLFNIDIYFISLTQIYCEMVSWYSTCYTLLSRKSLLLFFIQCFRVFIGFNSKYWMRCRSKYFWTTKKTNFKRCKMDHFTI